MIPVVKAHAYGNDFLLVPESVVEGDDLPVLARTLCERHQGIGADGLILYATSGRRIRMRLFNADGSSSEVSGNGVRCLAAYALEAELVAGDRARGARALTVETGAGDKHVELLERSGHRWTFRAAMGAPREIRQLELEAAGQRVTVVALSVGNPQCVVFGPIDQGRFRALGPALERHPAFPNRTNVSFVEVVSPERIRILIWERGVGPTSASGTGACGAAAAVMPHGGGRALEVESPGGVQRVEWREDGLFLTGWAEILFAGQWVAESATPAGD